MSKNRLLVLLAVFLMTMSSIFAQTTTETPTPSETAVLGLAVYVSGSGEKSTDGEVPVPMGTKIEIVHTEGYDVFLVNTAIVDDKGKAVKLVKSDIAAGTKLTKAQIDHLMTSSFNGKLGYKWTVTLATKDKAGKDVQQLHLTFVHGTKVNLPYEAHQEYHYKTNTHEDKN